MIITVVFLKLYGPHESCHLFLMSDAGRSVVIEGSRSVIPKLKFNMKVFVHFFLCIQVFKANEIEVSFTGCASDTSRLPCSLIDIYIISQHVLLASRQTVHLHIRVFLQVCCWYVGLFIIINRLWLTCDQTLLMLHIYFLCTPLRHRLTSIASRAACMQLSCLWLQLVVFIWQLLLRFAVFCE